MKDTSSLRGLTGIGKWKSMIKHTALIAVTLLYVIQSGVYYATGDKGLALTVAAYALGNVGIVWQTL